MKYPIVPWRFDGGGVLWRMSVLAVLFYLVSMTTASGELELLYALIRYKSLYLLDSSLIYKSHFESDLFKKIFKIERMIG